MFEQGLCSSIATTTVPVTVTAQKTSSQADQSATIEAEQAVPFLSLRWNLHVGRAARRAQRCARDGMNTQVLFSTAPKSHTGPQGR